MDGGPMFVAFALASQVLLVVFFAAHLLRWTVETAAGRIVYGFGVVALSLAVWLVAVGAAWYLAGALVLYAAWAGFGATVDILRPVAWREPARWSIVVPYAVLLMAALLSLWIPLWYLNWNAWLVFGVLFAAHTVLNLASHVAARRATAQATPTWP